MLIEKSAWRATVVLLLLGPLCGCGFFNGSFAGSAASKREKMEAALDSWIGQPAKQLIMKWGPPDKTDTDGAGGNIFTWREYNAPRKDFMGKVTGPGSTTVYMFWAHKAGEVYSWRYEES